MGLLLAIGAVGWYEWNEQDERRADTAAQVALRELAEALDAEVNAEISGKAQHSSEPAAQKDDSEMPVIVVDGVGYIGMLSIPELELDLPVQAECTEEALKNSPCRYWGTLKGGDLVIAGHNYKRHFTPVKHLKPGARVLFRDAENNSYAFAVNAVETVSGTDVEAMLKGGEAWDLTLFTCTYGGKDRVAIRCVRTDG